MADTLGRNLQPRRRRGLVAQGVAGESLFLPRFLRIQDSPSCYDSLMRNLRVEENAVCFRRSLPRRTAMHFRKTRRDCNCILCICFTNRQLLVKYRNTRTCRSAGSRLVTTMDLSNYFIQNPLAEVRVETRVGSGCGMVISRPRPDPKPYNG